MQSEKRFNSDSKKMIMFVVFWGTILGVLICLFQRFLAGKLVVLISDWLTNGRSDILKVRSATWMIRLIIGFPQGMIWGYGIALINVLLRRTTVVLTANEIVISRVGKKLLFKTEEFLERYLVQRNRAISFITWEKQKIYLRFRTTDGLRDCRLYEFSEDGLNRVEEAIKALQVLNIPMEERVRIQESLNEFVPIEMKDSQKNERMQKLQKQTQAESGPTIYRKENVFYFPVDQMIATERKIAYQTIALWVFWMIVVVVLEYLSIKYGGAINWKGVIYLSGFIILLLYVPFRLKRLVTLKKACARLIYIDGDQIWVNGKSYAYSNVTRIEMTSPYRKSGTKFYAVDYYMVFRINGVGRKYWLGTSNTYPHYRKLYDTLEKALVMYPDKLKKVK